MSYQGDPTPGATLRFPFNTLDADEAPTTLAGSPSLAVYKDDGTTESTAGVSLSVDHDGKTGLNIAIIDTSADGSFYSAGSNFSVVIAAGTVDGFSVVNRLVGSFSLRKSSAYAAVAALSIPTASDVATAVWASGTRTLTSFGTLVADVWGAATRVLTAGTNIVLAKGVGVTGFNDLSAAEVNTEVDTALADVGLTPTVTGRIDAAISSRLATAGYIPPDNATIAAIAAATITELAEILQDTSELQTDLTNGGRLDLLIDAIKAKTDNLPAAPAAVGDIPTSTQNADALLDRADAIWTGWTPRKVLRALSGSLGKLSGAGTGTEVMRDPTDSQNVITAVVDEDGNRSNVTFNV